MRLAGKVAIVAGGGQGLGAAACRAFAREGARVVVSDVNSANCERVVEEIRAAGGEALAIPASVTHYDEIEGVVREAIERFGQVDIMHTPAGILRPAMCWKMTEQQWQEVIDVHLTGTFHCLRAVVNHWIERRQGKFIAVVSPAGLRGQIGQINYCAAKAGIIGLVKGAAHELARYNIQVNAICPIASTPMTENVRSDEKLNKWFLDRIPLGRWAEPDEIAPSVVYLASADTDYMTGNVLEITGGRTM